METFVTALQTSVTSAKLWGELAPAAGLVGVLVIFAFGVMVVRRLVKGASKGKARI